MFADKYVLSTDDFSRVNLMLSKLLGLSDEEMQTIHAAAQPVTPYLRAQFSESVVTSSPKRQKPLAPQEPSTHRPYSFAVAP